MQNEEFFPHADWSLLEQTEIARIYRAGDLIYQQDDEAVRFYYLKSGRVRIFMSSKEGNEQTLTIKEPGSVFGEGAFFDGEARVSSARALTKSAVLSIDRPRLLTLFTQNPEFAFSLLQSMARNTRMLSSHIDRMAFRQADERLAALLLELQNDKGEVLQSQEELAQRTGVTRVTVTRVLKQFAAQGLVERGYRKLLLKNPAALSHYEGKEPHR